MKQTEAFRVLASADRQLVLHELINADGKATVEDLSRQVAARRHRTSSEKITDKKVERANIRLAHAHLPLLRDLNIIDWSGGTVALTNNECVDRLLEAAKELEGWPPDDLLQHPPS